MEEIKNELTYEMEMEDDVILPDGWGENDDFFDSDSWTGGGKEAGAASETDDESGAEESAMENSTEEAPATEPETGDEVTEGSEGDAPATEPAAPADQPSKFKVKFQFDHKDVEEEIGEADLPELMQKARSSERYKARMTEMQEAQKRAESMAKAFGYKSPEDLMTAVANNARNGEREALIAKGTPEEIVDDYLNRKYGPAEAAAEAPATEPEAKPAEPEPKSAPTFAEQARELISEFPKLSGQRLPDEVLTASASGKKTLLQAYREYKDKQDTAETNRLRKENQILRQNAASAARAPVSGVSKGGKTDTKPEDDFLKGFNEDY